MLCCLTPAPPSRRSLSATQTIICLQRKFYGFLSYSLEIKLNYAICEVSKYLSSSRHDEIYFNSSALAHCIWSQKKIRHHRAQHNKMIIVIFISLGINSHFVIFPLCCQCVVFWHDCVMGNLEVLQQLKNICIQKICNLRKILITPRNVAHDVAIFPSLESTL